MFSWNMALLRRRYFIHLSILSFLIKSVIMLDPLESHRFKGANEYACAEFTKESYFDHDVIVGKPWRIYYSWNLKMDKCLDMVFKNATLASINRIWADMHEYMEIQPPWESAMFVVTMGTASHEMLLIPDSGPGGRLLGVPNIVRDGRGITPTKGGVPLLRLAMKLIRNAKYLVIMDCIIGVASLAARYDEPVYRMEIDSVAAELNLGDGFTACNIDKNEKEYNLF